MEAFFSNFPSFNYNPQSSPNIEFARLCESRKWSSSHTINRHRNAFCKALADENSKLTDKVSLFFAQYPDFDYHADVPLAQTVDVEAEFKRLVEYRKWNPRNARYKKARKEFQHAVEQDASGSSRQGGVEHSNTIGSNPSTAPLSSHPPSSTSSGALNGGNTTITPPRTVGGATDEGVVSTSTASNSDATANAGDARARKRMKPTRVSVEVVLRGYEAKFSSELTPMDEFFAGYPEFNYDPTQHPIDEYERMAKVLGWDNRTYDAGYKPFYKATREEFRWQIFRPRQLTVRKRIMRAVDEQIRLGTIVEDETSTPNDIALQAFNRLCLMLGRDKGKDTDDAEKKLAGIHANIYDLIHHLRRNTIHNLHRFRSVPELAKYSYEHGIAYPWEEAGHNESSQVLKYLLRPIGLYKVRRRGRPRGCVDDPEFDRRLIPV